ncbi:carbohydrate kinase family protein [Psychroserpens sp. Hel_I_66]|uniref:carbohydrate kinase family protein n=1 Tax=Psychroserpens sp. Hel_I_66 TaxID=1250004 RepID=UPI00064902F0|nr:carbohydrate kinase family protein [Psychroserpens sp. Hel_I_66]
MNKAHKIAVVGPIPHDTIITHKNETIIKYGCVSHPTVALAKLLEGNGEVIPIAHVHKKDHNAILSLFKDYQAINTNGITSEKDQGTVIELNFIDQNNRRETQISNMHPISVEDVKPFLDVDCFVFVPITDFEIELETLKHIKANSEAQIIFDAHGQTTYVSNDGRRLRKYWEDKDDWLPYIDVLKMNLEESICSWIDDDYTDEDFYDDDNIGHLDEFATYILEKGVNYLYVTLDSRGCAIYKMKNGKMSKTFVKSVAVENVIDTTGCGDSFAGGLAFGFAIHNDSVKAAHFANTLGAMRTQGKGFDVFKSLAETEAIIKKNY